MFKVEIDGTVINCANKKQAIETYCKNYSKAKRLIIFDEKGKLYTKKGGIK